MLPQSRFARRPLRAAAVAKQLLEHRSRIPLHRQRLRGAPPGERVGVDATQIAGASARVGRSIHREFERCHLRLPGEVPREQLIHRNVRDDFHLVASAVRRARKKRPGGARVDVVPVRFDARQHQHLVPVRRQRLQNRRKLEGAPFTLRRPILHGHSVRHVERLESMRRLRGGPRPPRECGKHGIQKRQRHRRAEPSQHGPPRQRFRSQESHVCRLLISSTRMPASRTWDSGQSRE